jgi:hypothetical protein
MALYDHARFKVVQKSQHLFNHTLEEFLFSHPALPAGSLNVAEALSYILEVLYPRIAEQVATPADLPTGVDTPNAGDLVPNLFDQRIVNDDGDGKAAIYMFYKMDGQIAAQWNKVGDLDYGVNTVIQGLIDQTQYLFVKKLGAEDFDPITELVLTGFDAGQHIYGGISPNQNLTLHPTNGDDPATNTGFVQVNGAFRPYADLEFNSGTATERWLNGYYGTLTVGTATMTITSNALTGLITDTSGEISFGDENLTTLGNAYAQDFEASRNLIVNDGVDTLTIGTASITSSTGSIDISGNDLSNIAELFATQLTIGTLVVSDGSIVDSDGLIGFGATDLSTSGDITAETAILGRIELDTNLIIDGTTISTLAGSLNLNAVGDVDVQTSMTTLGVTTTGTIDITGSLIVDDVTVDGTGISVVGNILTVPSLLPDADGVRNLGSAASKFNNVFFSGSFLDGLGDSFSESDFFALSRNVYRNVAATLPAQDGDVLFYNSVSGKWLASAPDLEIEHSELSGLTTTDAGHTQFAMLVGRTGGQTILGEDGGGFGNLKLGASSGGALAEMTVASLQPDVDEALQLGGSVNRWSDLYMTGQAFGLRLENTVAPAGLFDAADVGRAAFNTADGFVYVNDGTEFKRVGNNSHNATYTNVELQSAIDVSASVDDARNCIWQLCDIAGSEEIMAVPIRKTATLVTVANTVALPAGSYRLIGIQV